MPDPVTRFISLLLLRKIRPEYALATPDVSESQRLERVRAISIEPLAQMKLTSFHNRDQMHIRDMIDVGLIDATWPTRFPPELAERLQLVLDTPEG